MCMALLHMWRCYTCRALLHMKVLGWDSRQDAPKVKKNIIGLSYAAQRACFNELEKITIQRSEKLWRGQTWSMIKTYQKRKVAINLKMLKIKFWDRQCFRNSQVWGKSVLRIKSWFFSKVVVWCPVTSCLLSHLGTFTCPCGALRSQELPGIWEYWLKDIELGRINRCN